jgi:N-acyl-phosphatidylethanolamine-hydrolysing phospholipase D
MDIMQHPSVVCLPTPRSFRPLHHGPPKQTAKSKGKAKSTGISLSDTESEASTTPRYFLNPWPSYRMATLSDAWTAYQKGAVVAPRSAASRPASRSSSRAGRSRTYADDNDDEDEQEERLQEETDGLILEPLPGASESQWRLWKARQAYVRPEFSQKHDEDEEDDWRDPPVRVLSPSWDTSEKEDVTWLGHAGVLVRIPWKDNDEEGRRGMCGVLFDPIFSYR